MCTRVLCVSAVVPCQVTFKRLEDPKEAGLQLELLKEYSYGETKSSCDGGVAPGVGDGAGSSSSCNLLYVRSLALNCNIVNMLAAGSIPAGSCCGCCIV